MARSSAQTRVLTDPEEIRMWAEERSAKPTCVKRTGGSDDVGIIRLDFPGYSGEDSLQEIDWDDWFEKFADSNLALLVQDTTAGGQQSNFNKLVSRETLDQRDEGSRSSRSEGRSSSSRRSNRSSSRSSASRSGSRTGRKQRTSARQASSRNRATSGSTGSSRRSTRSQSSGSAKRRAGSRGKTRVIGRASSTGKKSSGRSSSRTTRRAA